MAVSHSKCRLVRDSEVLLRRRDGITGLAQKTVVSVKGDSLLMAEDVAIYFQILSGIYLQEPLEYVRAVANYVTRESTLLSFRKGDVIQVVRDEQYVDKGK